MRSVTAAIALLITAAIALAPLSASAQQLRYSSPPVWGPPPSPPRGDIIGLPSLPPPISGVRNRAQVLIERRALYCTRGDLTRAQRLRYCREI